MAAPELSRRFTLDRPLDLNSQDFQNSKYDWYRSILEEQPACMGRVSIMKVGLVSRYEDCRTLLTDQDLFLRNRGRARGKPKAGPLPFPLPRSIAAVATSMILQDDPEHRRLRNLVNKAFTQRAVERLTSRVEVFTDDLLSDLDTESSIDISQHFARPIPTRVISEMMGLSGEDMKRFQDGFRILSDGLTGASMIRTLAWDLPKMSRFVRTLIKKKRQDPGEDILSRLVEAEEDGDRLNEQEIVAMVFLLIIGGFETTQHLITNSVHTLLIHPDQLARLRADPQLWPTAVDELVRHRGPIHGTKMVYPIRDISFQGVTFKRGTPMMPLIAAANHDPRVFQAPDAFDVGRTPNHHLGFGFGMHFCLGKQLALMETRIALSRLFDRFPNLHLAVDENQLTLSKQPGWHRFTQMPVRLK